MSVIDGLIGLDGVSSPFLPMPKDRELHAEDAIRRCYNNATVRQQGFNAQ
jgi:hypothetical protein